MPIEDTSMPFFPFVRGEFTNLLLQGQIGATTLSTARMLDFDEDTGTPRLNGSHRKNCMPIDVVGCGGAIPAVVAKQSRDLRSCRDAAAAMNKYLKPNVIKQHHI